MDGWNFGFDFLAGAIAAGVSGVVTRKRSGGSRSLLAVVAPAAAIGFLSGQLVYSAKWDAIWPYASIVYVLVNVISYLAAYHMTTARRVSLDPCARSMDA